MSDDAGIPPELEELERSLTAIRFEPRASLGPEVQGRIRRGEMPQGYRRARFAWQPRMLVRVLAPLLLLALLLIFTASQIFWLRRLVDVEQRFIPGRPRRIWLAIMTVVACVFLPLVLVYQGWTYWVFRRRVSAPRSAPGAS